MHGYFQSLEASVYLIVLTYIRFFVDRCDYCMVYGNNRNPTEAETELYERHIMNKHEAYTALLIDSEDPSKTVVCFDLQQILPSQKLSTTKQTFYKSRMTSCKGYQEGYCVSWSQVEGGMGSNEIATVRMRKHTYIHLIVLSSKFIV